MISARSSASPQRRRRRGDEVADAADVEHEAVRRASRRAAAKPRDHDASPARAAARAHGRSRPRARRPRVERAGSSSSERIVCTIRLHLILVGAAVAADRLLDARRGVLGALDAGGRGRDERGAARLPDGERDAGVGTDEGLLQRDGVRRVLRE